MTQVVTSAPGKIIVAGEYAVLQGAPAICMAVDRRARVSIDRSDTAAHSVSAPGYRPDEAQFRNIAMIADEHPVLAAVWDRFPAASQVALKIEIDTCSFHSGGEKLGIGSSAAVAVALTGAFNTIADASDVFAQAQAAHRAMQDGKGSGADVATSYHGGVIEYRMQKSGSAARLKWPVDLYFALLWSGHACDTAAQLQKLVGVGSSAAADALVAAAEDVAAAWHASAAQLILESMRHYVEALHHYDDEYHLDIFSAGHATLGEIAAASNLVYKPCGAGGGDFGIAVSDDLQTLRKFVATAEDEGFAYSDLAIDPLGLVVGQGEQ